MSRRMTDGHPATGLVAETDMLFFSNCALKPRDGTKYSSRRRAQVRALILRCCLLLVPLSVSACGTPHPRAVVERFYRALEKNDITSAKALLANTIVSVVSDTELRELLSIEAARITRCGGVKALHVPPKMDERVEKKPDTPFMVAYETPLCTLRVDLIYVRREGRSWKVEWRDGRGGVLQ